MIVFISRNNIFKEDNILISKKLRDYIALSPSKSTQMVAISELMDRCLENDILLPEFQTTLRWVLHKNVDLLNYQLSAKAPVSALSMHEIREDEDVKQINFMNRKRVEGNLVRKLSVIDGQQRISCNLKAYINDPEFEHIVLDLQKGKFIINKEKMKKSYQVPAGILLNRSSVELEKYAISRQPLSDNFQILLFIRTKLLSYNYIVNIGKGMSKTEQLSWFERLNNAGAQIPKLQLKLTHLTEKQIDIYDEYINKFIDIVNVKKLYKLVKMKNTEVSIPIALLNPAIEIINRKSHVTNYSPIASDIRFRDINEMSAENLRSAFTITLDCLKKSITFLEENRINYNRYDYIAYVTGFFVYLENDEMNAAHKSALVEWCSTVSFTNKSNKARREIYNQVLGFRYII